MKHLRSLIMLLAASALLSSCAVSKYAANSDYPAIQSNYEPQGSLEEVFFPSSEPGITRRHAFVYLPEGYHTDTLRRYPVFYLLHGARGNETVWIDKGDLLQSIDSLSASGAMLPTIVVLPNVNQYNDDRDYGHARLKNALESFYEVDGTVEAHFLKDVVSTTDSLFRTIADKNHRAVAGLSIGAMQSIYLSANSPDTFGYVGMFSPMVHSFLKPGPDNSFYSSLNKKLQIQFSDPPILYMVMIGDTDFFHPSTESWSRSLDRKGFRHEYHLAKGGHEWYNWSEFCNQFMQRLWKAE